MYVPNANAEDDWEQVEFLIKNFPLATIVTIQEGKIVANHIPFYLKIEGDKKFLYAHVAKANPQLPSWRDNDNVLVIFQSQNAYITPNYYPTKQETHKFVPTWDFGAVHIQGKSTIIDEKAFIRTQLQSLTDQEEAKRNKEGEVWKVDDAPEKYIDLKLKAITGLKIEIVSTECKFKFEQGMNRKEVDGVINGLKDHGLHEMSDLTKSSNERYDLKKANKLKQKEGGSTS